MQIKSIQVNNTSFSQGNICSNLPNIQNTSFPNTSYLTSLWIFTKVHVKYWMAQIKIRGYTGTVVQSSPFLC